MQNAPPGIFFVIAVHLIDGHRHRATQEKIVQYLVIEGPLPAAPLQADRSKAAGKEVSATLNCRFLNLCLRATKASRTIAIPKKFKTYPQQEPLLWTHIINATLMMWVRLYTTKHLSRLCCWSLSRFRGIKSMNSIQKTLV